MTDNAIPPTLRTLRSDDIAQSLEGNPLEEKHFGPQLMQITRLGEHYFLTDERSFPLSYQRVKATSDFLNAFLEQFDERDIETAKRRVLAYLYPSMYYQLYKEQPPDEWLRPESSYHANEQPQSEKLPGKVYLLYAGQYYKIGLTTNKIETRIKDIQRNTPWPITVVKVVETDDCAGLEAELHERFKERRVAGEWFALEEDEVNYIKALK